MSKTLLQLAATISKVETMSDRSIRLKVDTQEMQPEDEANIMKLRGKLGWFVFSDQELETKDIPDIKLDAEAGENKTQSQRIRNVLYRVWENTNGTLDFDTFYKKQTNIIIEYLKDKYLR